MMPLETQKQLQKQWFQAKLAAEKQKMAVVKKVKEGKGDFVLLDTRDRESFQKDHIPGALSMPTGEVPDLAGELDPLQEYVTYCWQST